MAIFSTVKCVFWLQFQSITDGFVSSNVPRQPCFFSLSSYDDLALINPQNCGSNSTFDDVFRLDRRYSSPYGLSSGPSHTPHVPSPRTYPISANIARGADLRDKARTHRLRSAQGPRRNLQPHCFPVYGRAYCTRKYARHVSTQYKYKYGKSVL